MEDTQRNLSETDPRSVMSKSEVADLLQVPENTLGNWRYLRKGPRSFKVGRHIRYLRTDVIKWLAEQHDSDPTSIEGSS